jgi:hypothetical protein
MTSIKKTEKKKNKEEVGNNSTIEVSDLMVCFAESTVY